MDTEPKPAEDDEVELHLADLGIPPWQEHLILWSAALTIPAASVQFFVHHGAVHEVARGVNILTWVAFVLVIVQRARVSGSVRHWVREHPLDVAVAVFSLPAFPYPMQLLRGVWILAMIRATGLSRRVFSGASIKYAMVVVLIAVVGGGSLFSALEPNTDVGTGVYWAMTTITTVGYGDVTPTTEATRVLAVLVMVVGIVTLGFLTAAASERFMRSVRRAEQAAGDDPAEAILARLDALATRLDRIEARLPAMRD